MAMLSKVLDSFLLWAAWIIIPLLMEVIPSFMSFLVLIKRMLFSKKIPVPIQYPEISIIVPVYNSSATLENCIRSIWESDYPNDRMRIFLVNNQGSDNSFEIYTKCQDAMPDLHMQWLNAKQGKSKALNMALYNSAGKYIVHIDSDGILEKHALNYLVDKFESENTINCMTGAILIQPELIEAYPKGMPQIFRKLEFLEYAQAFLAGRNYAAESNNIYTLSGAFSAFRKSAILNSWLYNTDTICEDTQITFQMKYMQKERVEISEKSLFFVDPIENVNKLYTQRQRWQRGSLEVSKMFLEKKMVVGRLFTDVNVRTLLYDHTFAFPRMIWYFALVCMTFIGYSGQTLVVAVASMMIMYIISGYLYFFSTIGFLKDFKEIRKYYAKQWWVVPLLPVFNFLVFFIRFAGVINSIGTDSAWKTNNLTDEKNAFMKVLKEEWVYPITLFQRLKNYVNEPVDSEGNRI